MSDFIQREIWIPINVNGDTDATALSGSPGLMFKGAETMFRLALFETMPQDVNNPGVFRNHANLISFLLKVRSGDYGASGVLLLDSSSGATVTINATVTEAQFIAREAAPISIYCPSAITAITTTGQPHYLSFTGATSDTPAQPDGFGFGRLAVKDIGIGAADSVAPAAPIAVTSDMFNAALAACVKYGKNPAGKTWTGVGSAGLVGRTFGCDDDGNAMAVLETYP